MAINEGMPYRPLDPQPRQSTLQGAGESSAYSAGKKLRRVLSAPTAYGAMGESYRLRGQAQSQAAAPVRAFGAGLVGSSPPTEGAPSPPTNATATGAAQPPIFRGDASQPLRPLDPTTFRSNEQTSFAGTVGGSSTRPQRTLAGGITATVDANGNPVYRGTGVPKPPGIPTPGPITAAASNAPQVQATTQRTLGQLRGNTLDARADAASVLNPMSADAEIMRRFEISQGYGSNKGSPQARRLAGEAILGQLSARNAASAAGQGAANTAVQQGALTEAAAYEGFANRLLEADQSNLGSDQLTAQRLAEQARPSQLGFVRALDGSTNIVRNDGTTGLLRDEAGNPIATPAPAQPGAITPQDLLKAQTDELKAAQQIMDPAERKAAVDDIRARYAALRGPTAGLVQNGYRFNGGDPWIEANWEKVN